MLRFDDYERLAHLRAERLIRERNLSPLCLDALHRPICSSLRLVEANDRASFDVQIAAIAPQQWGWVDCALAHKTEGPRAHRLHRSISRNQMSPPRSRLRERTRMSDPKNTAALP